mmetsp:Transcript_13099/g.29072  ORF Transcript_13099/g.29072 Transcript_13099/m.29072 type:complete len:712 (-) Transcript_13099:55-2190(-)
MPGVMSRLTRGRLSALGRAARPLTRGVRYARSFSSQPEAMEFKAETRKLLNIVAKSLYTDKEVFVRELISNASDACEKLRFLQQTGLTDITDSDVPLEISVEADESGRIFTITDTGVGMSREQMIDQLGTIAKSGSLDFVNTAAAGSASADSNIIGQFGVGFYSTFVVADKVQVFSRSADPSLGTGHVWESDGMGSFTVAEADDVSRGTKIVLHLKSDAAEFASQGKVKEAAQKYSSFVSFPLKVKEGGEMQELNKTEALWLKSDTTEDEHTQFFRFLGGTTYGEPLMTLKFSTDAPMSIKSVFYIPKDPPSRWFQKDPEIGVQLHSRRVLVKKHAEGVIPKWLFWLRGVVDCEDMPLNISRESMQDSRLMGKLSNALVRRLLRFLEEQGRKQPENYKTFYNGYSYYLKAGLLDDATSNGGAHKEAIVKLLRFECSQKDQGETVSLAEYLEGIPAAQQNIYYFYASDRGTAMASPYMEFFTKRQRNVLLLTDEVDEFVVNQISDFKGKKMVSIDAADQDFEPLLDAPAEDEASEHKLSAEDKEGFEAWIKGVLEGKIQNVKWSARLSGPPAVVTSQMSPHMRKMMKGLMAQSGGSNDAFNNLPNTLELNDSHHIVTTMNTIRESNPDVARMAAEQLHDNACIAAGMLEDPRSILTRLNKLLEMCVYQGAGFDYTTGQYTHPPQAPTPEFVVEEIPKKEASSAESKDKPKTD